MADHRLLFSHDPQETKRVHHQLKRGSPHPPSGEYLPLLAASAAPELPAEPNLTIICFFVFLFDHDDTPQEPRPVIPAISPLVEFKG
jgi:hypothetical protein